MNPNFENRMNYENQEFFSPQKQMSKSADICKLKETTIINIEGKGALFVILF
jgi:predicted secreted protein